MRINLIVLAFAIALLSMLGFSYFGTGGTAEATVDPLTSAECNSDASEAAILENREVDGVIPFAPNNTQHPPGLTGASNADNIAQPIKSTLGKGHFNALNGQSGVNNGCPGANPGE